MTIVFAAGGRIAGFDFMSVERLWFLAAVAVLAVVYVIRSRRGNQYAVKFTNLALLDSVAPKRPGWRRHPPAVLMLVSLIGLIGAFARPVGTERVPQERATIVLAIDTSLSMEATDVAPTRLAAAQTAAKDFVELLPERLNVGLLAFNGTPRLVVPPTQNREELKAGIDQLRLGERTAIGEAIYYSLDAIADAGGVSIPADRDGGSGTDDPGSGDPGSGDPDPDVDAAEDDDVVPASIVLMSDGSTTVGRPDAQAAAAAKEAGIPVHTISFGTEWGTIEIEGEPGPVSVAVDPAALERIANETGGVAYAAATGDELRAVYENIGSSIGYTTEERDISDRFVGASLIALLGAAVLSQVWFSRLP